MMSYWLDIMLGDNDDGNNLAKFAPLVIFFVIWLFGAIAKARSGKKDEAKKLPEGQEEQEPGFEQHRVERGGGVVKLRPEQRVVAVKVGPARRGRQPGATAARAAIVGSRLAVPSW